jgi:spore coat polysaccharide biosynthesis protein SpsF (cytidylyltransferase family)/predicted dehydrogenase
LRIGCLLSVREKATRLPGKVLLDVAGQPLTTFLLQRLAMAKSIDTVVLATSTHPSDEILANLATNEGFAAFRGSEDDKLDRYYQAAVMHKLDSVIIVDGDDPFCFPEWIDNVAVALREGKDDCVYITGLPLGAASTGLTTDALRRVLELKDEQDTEVWGGYFIGSGRFSAREIKVEDPLLKHPEIRLTLDYEEDYELVCRVVDALGSRVDFTSRELMELLVNKRPELASINRDAQVRYESHIQKSAPVKFKEGGEIRALVIGLGSMGKRRVRNLGALGVTKIVGFDIRKDRREEAAKIYGIPVFDSFELALRESAANLLIVSTPPDLHMHYAHLGFDLGLHCFLEASVVDADGIADLARKVSGTGLVMAPSCTMRYYPGPQKVKELIAAGVIGKVLNVNYQTGQYLPDWHPWERIQDYYVSRRETGAAREIVPFELTWLNDLFGTPTPLACVKAKLTDMTADIDDVYHCILRYDSGVLVNMTIEVISRPVATREMRVMGSEGEIVFSADAKNVRFINTSMSEWKVHAIEAGTVESQYINPEEPYIAEIRDFLSAVQKSDAGLFPNSLYRDVMVLKALYALEKLSEVAS